MQAPCCTRRARPSLTCTPDALPRPSPAPLAWCGFLYSFIAATAAHLATRCVGVSMSVSPFEVGLSPSRKESRVPQLVPQHSNSRADLFLPLPSFATNPQYHISKVHPSQPKVHPPGTGTTASTHDRTGCKADTTHTHPNAPASKTRPSIHTPGLLPSARRAPANLTPGTQTSPL